jgi:hypothetical protein
MINQKRKLDIMEVFVTQAVTIESRIVKKTSINANPKIRVA